MFAGLRDGYGVSVSVAMGYKTSALKSIHVTPDRGLGGLIWRSRESMLVCNYQDASEITHDFDDQILGEGITDLAAAPFVVDGDVRGLIYAGYRGVGHVAANSVAQLVNQADSIASELRVRDEGDRRVAALIAREHRGIDGDSAVRWLARLEATAADAADSSTRRKLEALIAGAAVFDTPHVELTRDSCRFCHSLLSGIRTRLSLSPWA